MDEDIDILSDSSDTVVYPANIDLSPRPDAIDSDISNIINKYISKNYSPPQVKTDVVIELSDDEEIDTVPVIKKIKSSKAGNEILSPSSSQHEDVNDDDVLQMLSEKYKTVSDKKDNLLSPQEENDGFKPLSKKEVKQLQQRQKSEERKRKKAETQREKSLKQALAAANKNIKPGECMKFVCVHLDNDVVNDDYGNEIMNTLKAADVNYTISSQIFPNTISWTRKTQLHSIEGDGKLALSSQDSDTDNIVLIMKCKEFIEHVHNNSLISYIQSVKSILINKRITLIIFNLQSYLKYQKNQKQKEFAASVSQDNQQKQTKSDRQYQDFPKISMKTIEFALTELQILCKCSYRSLKSPSEVALVVVQFTKAIAEIPYKLKKHEKYQQIDWFAGGDNRDCVKIDKNGNGLQRLWKQMLTSFPMANLEIAEAISAKYPTMTSLINAYEDPSLEKPELLLQDIPIRRAAGPLSSSRRLGPELSKKLFKFFTSLDGDITL